MKRRILIVDDEKGITMSLRRMFELEGYEIEEIHRGAEAFRRLSTTDFDLVLLDYLLPDVKGDKVLDMIRSDERLRDLPVFIVTAYHDQTEERLKACGATEVFYKPVSAETLIRRAKEYLAE